MTAHPSWPAELVEKVAALLRRETRAFRTPIITDSAIHRVAQAVLSALSGDLVPREEHERAIEEVLWDDPEKWSFRALVKVARLMLAANYPPDVFVGGGPATDSGVQFVVALRNALASVGADEALPSEVVARSQADALAEALERARNAIGAVGGAIYLMEPNQGERPDWAASRRTLVGVCDDLGETLASYRKTASGETEG